MLWNLRPVPVTGASLPLIKRCLCRSMINTSEISMALFFVVIPWIIFSRVKSPVRRLLMSIDPWSGDRRLLKRKDFWSGDRRTRLPHPEHIHKNSWILAPDFLYSDRKAVPLSGFKTYSADCGYIGRGPWKAATGRLWPRKRPGTCPTGCPRHPPGCPGRTRRRCRWRLPPTIR